MLPILKRQDWDGLNSNIVLISKRRQQLKQVLVDMVQEVCPQCFKDVSNKLFSSLFISY
jgi:NMD protein affecting ribosome stability and mRNA decay